MSSTQVLEEAATAASRGDWQRAYEILSKADEAGLLTAAELPLLADAAYGAGHLAVTFAAWERAHAERVRAGDRRGAAEAAVRVAQHLMIDTALMAPTRAWIIRAETFLDGEEDNAVFAWVAVVRNYERLLSGDFTGARAWARRAIEVGARCEPAAAAVGKVAEARSLILEGSVREGLRLLDEAAAVALSGELPPVPAGMIYCELVCGAQGVAQYDLAEEWTAAMEGWSASRATGSMHGRCRIHRAEILRLRGSLRDAEAEALAACEELRPYLRRELGWPLTELGMCRLRRGNLDGAEAAFLEAHEMAWDPHPGFALVHLARGDVAGAAAAIDEALDHPLAIPSKERPPNTDLRRPPLLEAKVEIALAAGDVDGARTAADELERLAARFESRPFAASAALSRGRVLLAGGDPAGARLQLEAAVELWSEVRAPYEAAVARAGLAAALQAGGQEQRARLELRTATSTLERLGAVYHAVPHASSEVPPPAAPPPSSPGPSSAPGAPTTGNVFRLEGETWLIALDGRSIRLRDLKGLRYLARLFGHPGVELHVLDLVRQESGAAGAGEPSSSAADPDLPISSLGDAGVLLDARAKEMYRRRLVDIEQDLDDARAMGDTGRVTQAERERDFLVRELSRAVGVGGRDRVAGSASERARVAATRAVRQAISRIREHHPALADHLDRTVRTGTYFAYRPDPRAPIAWEL